MYTRKARIVAAGLALSLLGTFFLIASPAGAAPSAKRPTATMGGAVSGSCVIDPDLDPSTDNSLTGSFDGAFRVIRFGVNDGRLLAAGTLTGTCVSTDGTVSRTVSQTTIVPVSPSSTVAGAVAQQAAAGSCPILHLVIGPINLDLLGLQITTNQIVLDITAQSGPGNLLGNLLCAVAGLLDGTGLGPQLTQIANLLNQILAILG